MPVESQRAEILRFGPFEVDPRAAELRKRGVRIKLQEQPFQVLKILLGRPGEIVSREEIKSQIWPSDTFVEFDNGLNTAINKVREALGDSADNPRFVETVPKHGYRFVAPVVLTEEETNIAAVSSRLERLDWRTVFVLLSLLLATLFLLKFLRVPDRILSGMRGPRVKSLAVLPLTNLSGDPAQEYFSDGMTDALITDLAGMGLGKVISRTSVMRYKGTGKSLPEIARELNVDGIVEGTVQRSGDRVRITAQLIEGISDRHLWANTYERDISDVLALQDELALAIASEIKFKVMPPAQQRSKPQLVNPQAYQTYLQGLVYSRHEGVESKRISLDYFNRAIQLDPRWAEPYAQIARSDDWIADTGGHPEFYPQAKAAALTAIRMNESLAEAHAALGDALFNYDWEWSGAEHEFQRALELNPNYAEAHLMYSQLLMAAGRSSEAISEVRRAQELDPLMPAVRLIVGLVYSCVGRTGEAIEQLHNLTELNPNYDMGYGALGFVYLQKGMYQEAIANLEKARQMDKDDPDVVLDDVNLVYGYAVAGRQREARKLLVTLENQESAGRDLGDVGLYRTYFALGDEDRGFAWMEQALKKKSEALLYLRCWPEFDRMLGDPRFADIVRRVGIPR